ncbi:MAG: MmcQ/YjbR family DNA-binding protein [Bacteroidota bacterium]
MGSIETVRKVALSLPDTSEEPHFEKTSFRAKKKIFATFDKKTGKLCVKLSEIDQNVFSSFDPSIIYPVPNKWGKQGWTLVEISKIKTEMLFDLITTAYGEVTRKGLAK